MSDDLKITIVDKATQAATVLAGQEVTLADQSIIELPLRREHVKSLARQGSDLVITTVDEQTIVVHGFFAEDQTHSDLVLQESALEPTGDLEVVDDEVVASGTRWLANLDQLDAQPEGLIDLATESGSNIFALLPPSSALDAASQMPLLVGQDSTASIQLAMTGEAGESGESNAALHEGTDGLSWLPLFFAAAGLTTAAGGSSHADSSHRTPPPGAPQVFSVTQDDNGALTVTGAAQPGGTVTVNFADHSSAAAQAGSDGRYEVTSDAPQTSGAVQVVVADAAGNVSAVTSYTAITLGAIAPDTGASASDLVTADGALTFSGALGQPLADGQQAQISLDGGKNWNPVTVDGANWSYDSAAAPLTDGAYKISVRVIDAAGDTRAQTARTVLVDTTAPTETSSVADTSADGTTFSGTLSAPLNQDGGATETLQISLDHGQSWRAVTVDSDGVNWTYSGDAMLDAGSRTVQTRVVDAAGNVGEVTSQAVQVGGTPTQTVTLLSVSAGVGSENISTTNNEPNFQLLLSAAPVTGQVVQISLDGGSHWFDSKQTTTDGSTVASFGYQPTTALDDGNYTVLTRMYDKISGKGGAVSIQHVIIDTTKPEETVTLTSVTDGTATADGFATDTGALTLGGTLSGALNASDGSPETLQISLDNGHTWRAAKVDGKTWTYNNTHPLADGLYTVQARVADAAGNVGEVLTTQLQVGGGTLPVATLTGLSGVNYLGVPSALPVLSAGDDLLANADRLILQGATSVPLGDGQQVQVSLDGGTTWKDAEASDDGATWTYDNSANTWADGNHAVQMRVVDTAQDQPGAATEQRILVDATPPGATVSIAQIANGAGAVAGDGLVTSDAALVIIGTLSAPLNAKGGTTETLQISLDGGYTWHTAGVAGTIWTYDNSANPLADGTYTLEARVIDAAGNVGELAVRQLVVDSQHVAPTQTATLTSISEDTGASNSDFITSDSSLVLTGALGAALADGQRVQISFDGGQSWQGVTSQGATEAHPDGLSWAVYPYHTGALPPDGSTPGQFPTTPLLTDGNYTVETRVYDANTGLAGPVGSQLLVIDTTAPTETVVIAASAASSADGVTFTGTLSAPLNQNSGSVESLQISFDGGEHWLAVSGGAAIKGSTWNYTSATALDAGLHAVEARVIDAAGNAGAVAKQAVGVSTEDGTLNLSLADVLAVTQVTGKPVEIPASANTTTVHLTDGLGGGETQWQTTGTQTVGGAIYDVYHNTSMTTTAADLLIQVGVTVV